MKQNHNQWVDKLLGVYQYSKIGNSDNRGLDSEFSKETYIPTKLDEELLPDIVEGKYKVLFLTGNAGDGKTAFLEKVYDKLLENQGRRVLKNPAGWTVEYNEKVFISCYDASESEEDGKISANERLLDLFAHLKGNTEPQTKKVLLIAINDGKLHAFFHEYKNEFTWLNQQIFGLIFNNRADEGTVCIVNLKDRALVDLEFDGQNENSLLDKNLKTFLQEDKWQICRECFSANHCPVFYNASVLGLLNNSSRIRAHLKLLFTINHLKKQRHDTIRNIRSAMAFVITSNLTCEDVHDMIDKAEHTKLYRHLYFNSIFNSPDDALVEMNEIDPGSKVLPRLDKKILDYHRSGQTALLQKLLVTKELSIEYEKLDLTYNEIISSWRRRLYFEADDELLIEEFDEVEHFNDLLPYSHFKEYLRYLRKAGDTKHLKKDISRGIAQLEGIRNTALAGEYLMIKVTQNSREGLTVCRKYDLDEFIAYTPGKEKKYLETLPDVILFMHQNAGIKTKISLDIFEVIKRMAEGQLPDSEEQKPILDELTEFKSRLHRLHSQDLLLIEGSGLFHNVYQEDGCIVREKQLEESHEN